MPNTDPDAVKREPPLALIAARDLPISCPMPGVVPDGLHPRVYIPLERAGDERVCPYCGARYRLEG